MTDPLLAPAVTDIVEKVGLAVATIIGLVYVLKWLSQMHLKALNDRITTLEAVLQAKDALLAKQDMRLDLVQSDLLARTEVHAHDMKAIAMQMMVNDKANRDFMRAHQAVIVDLVDKLNHRQCMAREYHPQTEAHKTTSARPDLPTVPETDRTTST